MFQKLGVDQRINHYQPTIHSLTIMKWEFGRRSDNVEDRRGMPVSGPVVGGGIGAIVLALLVALAGGDPSVVLRQTSNQAPVQQPRSSQATRNDDSLAQFVSVVLAETEDTWGTLFQRMGKTYREPKLVLFSGAVQSACGLAESAAGPFYCPSDQKVYIDLEFFRDLKYRHQAPGDFAQAYVIAHEVGHHVQNQLGILRQVNTLQQQVSKTQANQLQVRVELQADCFAGVWAHQTQRSKQILEEGDVEEALNAASSIGDDRLQREARGYVVPDSFTHGSSAQRVRWFTRGLQTGSVAKCNAFESANL
jgi:predicted metalloprotease